MKYITLFIFFITFFSCKERPNYNPFDDQFNISKDYLIEDNCDTINATCGYYNLIQKGGKLKTFYQYYDEDNTSHLIAKGFTYNLNIIRYKSVLEMYYILRDSLLDLPINEKEVEDELNTFGYGILYISSDSMVIVNDNEKDTILLNIIVEHDYKEKVIYRNLEYFKNIIF